jgi:hypothetical protein
LPWFAAGFCAKAGADRAQALFASRIDKLEGGPRTLATVLEMVTQCGAEVEQLRAPVAAFFAAQKKP